jgi:hypothetical protein
MDAHAKAEYSLQQFILLLNKEDFYSALMLWGVSRFTGNPHIFFGIAAIIMGFFLVKTSWLVLNRVRLDSHITKLLIFAMFAAAPIWNVGFVRWWTAMYVFLYGFLSWIFDKSKLKLLWCVAAIFIHYTFLFPFYGLCAYLLLPKKSIVPYVIVYVTFNFISNFDLLSVSDYITALVPPNYDSAHVIRYLTIGAENLDSRNGLTKLGTSISSWIELAFVIILTLRSRKVIEQNVEMRKLFIATMIIGSICLFINLAPWGIRFLDLNNFTCYALFAVIMSDPGIWSKHSNYIGAFSPFLVFFSLFQIKTGLHSIGFLNLFLGNFFTVLSYEDNIPIMNLLGL